MIQQMRLYIFKIECTCEKTNALFAVVSNDRIIKKIQANETINF